MPPNKRRKTDRDSSASSRAGSERSLSGSPRPHKSARKRTYEDKENDDPKTATEPHVDYAGVTPHSGGSGGFPVSLRNTQGKKPYEYICFHRPLFDVDGENWRNWSIGKVERLEKDDIVAKLYKPGYIEESKRGIWGAPPAEHQNHKWVIMRDAWLRFDGFCRRVKYCNSNISDMHIHTDWEGWSMKEIVDDAMLDFNEAYKQKGGERLERMWAIMSAIGLWMNVEDVAELINTVNGENDCELIGLLGCALLTVLSAIDRAGELTTGSCFLDLALVIGNFLELSHDLPAYGIEGPCVFWRKEAVHLFKKGNLDPKRALFDTEHRLKQLEDVPNVESCNSDDETDDENDAELVQPRRGTEGDPWAWTATMSAYQKKYKNTFGLQPCETTEFVNLERAQTSSDGKDPLADISVNDIRRNVPHVA